MLRPFDVERTNVHNCKKERNPQSRGTGAGVAVLIRRDDRAAKNLETAADFIIRRPLYILI